MTETEDTFDSSAVGPIRVDVSSIPRGPPGPASEASTIATALASEVNSVVGGPSDAFLRSFTFFRNDPGTEWSIVLADPPNSSASFSKRRVSLSRQKRRVTIDSLSGAASLSCLKVGDAIKTINGKRVGQSYTAQKTEQLMTTSLEEKGFLSIICGNDGGDDVLIQATILKPKATSTYDELGLKVWYWGVLVVKSIAKDSLFKQTALSSEDHVVSINDIVCDEMKPEAFAHVMNNLPDVVTIVAKRKKERWTGKFG